MVNIYKISNNESIATVIPVMGNCKLIWEICVIENINDIFSLKRGNIILGLSDIIKIYNNILLLSGTCVTAKIYIEIILRDQYGLDLNDNLNILRKVVIDFSIKKC